MSAVCVTFTVTACGGDGGEENDGKKAKAVGESAEPAAKALTAGELEKLVIAQGDVKGREVKKPGKGEAFEAGDLTVEKAACKPVAQVLSALPAGKPAASAQRLVVHKSEKAGKGIPPVDELADMTDQEVEDATLDSLDITKTQTSLWSYDADGAHQTLATLRKAAKKCAGGFRMTIDGEKQRVTEIAEEKMSVGEEAVAWTVGTKQDDTDADTKVVVFRKGTTLAGFSSFNIASMTRGEAYGQPTAVINAQAAKLANGT
ncbi:hypothetical protein [Streptomyces oryzae]|uniref:hypothetical protein n=1 Tax=Streptomyces oryzae TaxID=1434886 RepID=UPI0027DCCDC8|nr:hypothetical protein [Streptomyces oryzae]